MSQNQVDRAHFFIGPDLCFKGVLLVKGKLESKLKRILDCCLVPMKHVSNQIGNMNGPVSRGETVSENKQIM